MIALRFTGVSKRYGSRVALDRLSFSVPVGSLCGFVGANGAGKTTAFSIVGGFAAPDAGAVDVLGGGPFDPWRLKGRLGLLPQDADLGERHTPRELCAHLARLGGLSARDAATAADRALSLVQLGDRFDARIGSLSHGMRRRVAVATALVGQPELVILDEPTSGLDPVQARSLREALRDRPRGQTIVLSTHQLDEVERLCDHVVIIERGRCVAEGPIDTVTDRGASMEWILSAPAPLDALVASLPAHRFEARDNRLHQRIPSGEDPGAASLAVMKVLVAAGIGVVQVQRGTRLEERFFGV